MDLFSILKTATDNSASDIFIVGGAPLSYKAHGVISRLGEGILTTADTEALVREIFKISNMPLENDKLPEREMDFSFSVSGMGRFRANIYKQRGSFAAVLRFVPFELPDAQKLGIPEQVMEFSKCKGGIVLITGAASNGKSTTLSCIINRINSTQKNHIITIEDPIEYVYKPKLATIHQREIGTDVPDFNTALRSGLRENPDVILVGEMRDFETISLALRAAETGHLVLGTLHTTGAPHTVNRIIDVFPSEMQNQVRSQLSTNLRGVVSQMLIPMKNSDRGRTAAFEILINTDASANNIRAEKVHQLEQVMASGASQGMRTMNESLKRLVRDDVITREAAMIYSPDKDELKKLL